MILPLLIFLLYLSLSFLEVNKEDAYLFYLLILLLGCVYHFLLSTFWWGCACVNLLLLLLLLYNSLLFLEFLGRTLI